ncbi:MAG: AAA family ATPase [Bacteroidota bacterium]
MIIDNISVSNFKSFNRMEISLGSFNVLIGPNAAGKSNFIQIFKFVRDITSHGLENAIALQGGTEFLRNINLTEKESALEFNIEARPSTPLKIISNRSDKNALIDSYKFSFTLHFDDSGYRVAEDRIILAFREGEAGKKGTVEYSSSQADIKTTINLENADKLEDIFMPPVREEPAPGEAPECRLMLENLNHLIPYSNIIKRVIGSITVYDFDPKFQKFAAPVAGKAELEEDASNLAIVLQKILSDQEESRKLFNLMQELLPFIDNLEVDKFYGRYLQILLRERYSEKDKLPAFLMSSGTVFLISLIIALYFEKKPINIFEEPERRIHPYLMSKIINMMRDASEHKQILISTHNPEMVRHAGIKNILFVTRDGDGFSSITRPAENAEIREFLKNQIGIEELYVQNLI